MTTNPDFSSLLNPWQKDLLHLGLGQQQIANLIRFLARLWQANQELNLVSRKLRASALISGHLMDSLIALPFLPRSKEVADLGSGGGFPVLPLAIALPQTKFLLYEKSPLKCRFLQSLTEIAPNIQIFPGLIPHQLPSTVDLVICRGFKPIDVLLTMTANYRRAGGRYALYKGRRERIETELKRYQRMPDKGKAKNQGFNIEIQPLPASAWAEERHLVLMGPPSGEKI